MIDFNINWFQFANLISPWGVPLAAGLLILLICPFLKNHHRYAFVISLAGLFISLWLAIHNWVGAQETVVGSLLFDKISYFFVILFLIAAILVILLSHHFLETFGINRPEFYALILFCVFGMGCMAAGSDLMVIFLGLEIMSVSLYILAGFHRTNIFSIEASLKYFLVGAFASSFLLLGIAFVYGASGTTDFMILNQKGMELAAGDTRLYLMLGLGLIAVGLGFKVAAVPFHFWAPDVYEGSPLVVTAWMATAVKAAGFAVILRAVWALFQWEPALFAKIIWIAAVLTMTVGNISAILQRNLKRMLAYSSIAHVGYLLIPFVAFHEQSSAVVSSVGFYLLAYILMTIGAFAVLIALTTDKEEVQISDLTGLGYKKPFLGFALTLFLISLAGIPPTIGFFGKYYLFLQAVHVGQIGLVVIAVINSVISVYYYLGPVVAMYFTKEALTAPKEKRAAWGMPQTVLAVIWIAFLCVALLGLFPSNILSMIQQSASTWLVAVK